MVNKISKLTHTIQHAQGGSGKPQHYSCNFLINNRSLLSMLKHALGSDYCDLIGCFIAGNSEYNNQKHQQLLMKASTDTDSGRIMLYVCPLCADLGCGSYTVEVIQSDEGYWWQSFAYENGYEEPHLLESVGPFLFEKIAYERAIENAAYLIER